MPQDSYQQALVREALVRFPQPAGDPLADISFSLSGLEIATIRAVLEDFIRVPAAPGPDGPPRPGA